ncbi:MAG: hypothetical protein KBC26_01025 [Candidatus Pacebacteria bacterium]|nr:hypothetical protein [Candidatus Paceibacterota bacterium]
MTGLEIFLLVFLCGALVCVINLAREVRDRSWFIRVMCTREMMIHIRLSQAARGLEEYFQKEIARQQECVKQGIDPSQDADLCRMKKQSTLFKKRFWKLVRLAKEYGLIYESWASAKEKSKRYSDFIDPEDTSYRLYLG